MRAGVWSVLHAGGDMGSDASVHHACNCGGSAWDDCRGGGCDMHEVGLPRAGGYRGIMVCVTSVCRLAVGSDTGRHQALCAGGTHLSNPLGAKYTIPVHDD